MTTLKMLPCGHEFHKECFLSWINTGRANVGFLLCLSVFLCLSLCICFSLPVSLSLSVSLPLSLCLNLCSSISAYAKYIITEAIFQFPHYTIIRGIVRFAVNASDAKESAAKFISSSSKIMMMNIVPHSDIWVVK